MYNRTDANGKKQSTFTHGNNQQSRNPVTPENRGENKKTTIRPRPTDQQASCLQENSTYHAHCSSITVQQRAIEPKQSTNEPSPQELNELFEHNFNNLLAPYQFTDMEEMAYRFHRNYNGKAHSMYAVLIKKFLFYKQNLNTNQINKLLLVLKIHDPRPESTWAWRSLATAFHSWTSVYLFAPNKNLDEEAVRIQKNILTGFLDQFLERHKTNKSLPGITPRSVASMMGSIEILVCQGLTLKHNPKLKKVMIALWLHAKTRATTESKKSEEQFNLQELAMLLGVMGKLGSDVLSDSKHAQDFKDTVITLLTLMETQTKTKPEEKECLFRIQDVITTIDSLPKMTCIGLLTDVKKLNTSVTLLLPFIAKYKNCIFAQSINVILRASTELATSGWLNIENTQKLKDTVNMLLPIMQTAIESIKNKTRMNVQEVARTLRSIATLLDVNMSNDTTMLNTFVPMLWSLIIKQKHQLTIFSIDSLLWATAKLMLSLKEAKNTQTPEETVVMLLELWERKVNLKVEKHYFTALESSITLWSIAKILDNGITLNQEDMLNRTMALLLPIIADHTVDLQALGTKQTLWAASKLIECELNRKNINLLQAIVIRLLSNIKIKFDSKESEWQQKFFFPKTVLQLLRLITKLTSTIMILKGEDIRQLVLMLLVFIDSQEKPFLPYTIANLMWCIATLGEAIEIEIAMTMFVSLVNMIDTYKNFTRPEVMMSFWALIVCSARLYLNGSADNAILQTHIKNIFFQMKNDPLEMQNDRTLMIQASAWIGEKCTISQNYPTIISQYQCNVYQALSEEFSSLKITEEKSIYDLPPMDICFPDYKIAVEVQGPYHYVCDDLKSRNGSTLLKIALLEKMGYDVIEVVSISEIPDSDYTSSMKACIEKIQKKINSDPCSLSPISDTGQNSSDTEYLTTNENNDSSFSATASSTETEWQKVIGKKKRHRMKYY